jgi:hypothetical protein
MKRRREGAEVAGTDSVERLAAEKRHHALLVQLAVASCGRGAVRRHVQLFERPLDELGVRHRRWAQRCIGTLLDGSCFSRTAHEPRGLRKGRRVALDAGVAPKALADAVLVCEWKVNEPAGLSAPHYLTNTANVSRAHDNLMGDVSRARAA